MYMSIAYNEKTVDTKMCKMGNINNGPEKTDKTGMKTMKTCTSG